MITDRFNFIKDATKAFGVIPAAYASLIDLGTDYHYNHIQLVNTTDQSVVIKFVNSAIVAEYTIPSNSSQTFDQFSHKDEIEYRYVGVVAPTVGFFKLTSWLGLQ